MKKLALALVVTSTLAACEVSQPVTVIGDNGEIFRGSATASAQGGSFTASNGPVTCAGTYDAMSMSITVSFPVICDDGRRGLGTATRDASGMTGAGTIRMTDGSEWSFVFGPVANTI